MIKQYKLRFYNFRLVLFLLLVSGIGVELVGTARQDLQTKQLAGVILGVTIMLILSLIDYSWILNFQWIMYGFNIVMLLGVRLFGDSANGAARWIDLGFIRFQPTELTKIIIILFFAKFFMDHEDDLNTLKTLVQAAVLLIIPLVLVYSQPDMKNTITIAVMFCILIYIAGLSYKIIGGSILIAIPLLIIFLSIVVQPDQNLIKDYQRDRIMSFLYPENEEYSDNVEQQNNSKTAIASGELIGKRLSKEENTASVNEGNFVAENQTDFIFAVVGEEYGFIGCSAIVILLFLIAAECVRMSLRAKDQAGKIICCGVGTIVALQAFLNISVATGIAPNTGTPLPFVSYGLTSLVSVFIGMGFVLNVGLQGRAYKKDIEKRFLSERGILMTAREREIERTKRKPPSRAVSRARMRRMRRRRIRNTILLLLILVTFGCGGGYLVYKLQGGSFSSPFQEFDASREFENTLVSKESQKAPAFAAELCVVEGDVPLETVNLQEEQKGLLLNLDSKETMYAKGAYERVYPASITKIRLRFWHFSTAIWKM